MITQDWKGHKIRFVEINGEWYAVLKDICDAVNISTRDARDRIRPEDMVKVPIDMEFDVGNTHSEMPKRGNYSNRIMITVNEYGIYDVLFTSRRLEAEQFRRWIFDILRNIRESAGLRGYEIMDIMNPDIALNTNITMKYTGKPRHTGNG